MTDTATDEALAKRRAAFQNLTMADRQARHDKIAGQKAEALEARRVQGRAYTADHPPAIDVGLDVAIGWTELIEETRGARDEAAALAAGRSAEINNGALEFPVLGHEFAADGPCVRLGTEPLILAPVVQYLGMMPILFNMFVTRAHTTTFLPGTAHRFHLDPEDVRSFKVFVHLTDVDDDCGPFHALPADLSAKVLDAVDYRGVTMLDDEQIDRMAGWDSVIKVTGPPGTVALADTTRCLHFGGRPRKPGKPVREMLVYQYLLPTSVLLVPEDDRPPRRFLPQLESTGDDAWDALIGHRFV